MMILPGPRVVAVLLTLAFLVSTFNDVLAGAFTATLQLFGDLRPAQVPQPKTLVLLGAGLIGVSWLTWLRRRRRS